MDVKFKIIFTAIVLIMAPTFYKLFQLVHNRLNNKLTAYYPKLVSRFPWLFTDKHHDVVLIMVYLKAFVGIVLVWFNVIEVPFLK